ncbi:MAG: zinc-ribbon domain-containing protein [Clostridiales bacterium]|nr:zinc-ribbon domain-containing protein [Clostridiales bacterium]
MKYCSQCGASCKDEAMFCTSCGHKLNEGAPSPVVSPQQAAPPEPNVPPQQTAPPESNVPPQQTAPPEPNIPPQQAAPPEPNIPPQQAAPPEPNVPPQQTAPPEPNIPPQQTAPPETNVPPQQTAPPEPNVPPQQGVPPYLNTPPHGQGYPGYYPGAIPPRPVASMNRTSLVEMLNSPVLLILTILLSGSVLFTFVSLCLGQWPVIFGLVPTVLGIVGLWMLVSSVSEYRTRGKPISLSNFPLFKISNIASIVLDSIYTLTIDIILIIYMAELGRYARYMVGGSAVMAVLALSLIFLTVFEVFKILYHVKGLKVITDIRIALETGQPVKPLSKYFVIFSFIIGICLVIGSIFVLVMVTIANDEMGGGYLAGSVAAAVLLLISSLSGSGFYIILGIFLSKLNRQAAYYPQR